MIRAIYVGIALTFVHVTKTNNSTGTSDCAVPERREAKDCFAWRWGKKLNLWTFRTVPKSH